MGNHYLIVHEETCGSGGLDPDANVSLSVGRKDVTFVINDLEKKPVKPSVQSSPNTSVHLNTGWLIHGAPVETSDESDRVTVSEN
jgi:hypothetical protein